MRARGQVLPAQRQREPGTLGLRVQAGVGVAFWGVREAKPQCSAAGEMRESGTWVGGCVLLLPTLNEALDPVDLCLFWGVGCEGL